MTATARPRRKRARPEHAAPWSWLTLGGYDVANGGIVRGTTVSEPDWLGRVPLTLTLLLPSADYIPDGLRELATAPPHDDGRDEDGREPEGGVDVRTR